MGRVGDANIASGFQTDANQLEQRIKAQLDLSESEWGTQSGTENQQSGGEGGDGNNDSGGESEPPTEGPYVKARNSEPVLLKRASRPMSGLTYGTPGDEPAEKEVTISAGGEVVKTKTVSVGTVRSQTVIKAAVSDPGTYEITVNGKSAGEIVVFDSSSEDGEGANESGSVSVDSFSIPKTHFATGVFLAFISVAVFLLGVMLEVARSFKNRSNGESPILPNK